MTRCTTATWVRTRALSGFHPPSAKQRVFRPTTEQVWRLYDLMPAHLRESVLLGAFAGLRVAEAVAIRTKDVEFTRGVVHPKVQWGIEGVLPLKTEGSDAPIPIPRELTMLLSSSVQQWPGGTLVTNGLVGRSDRGSSTARYGMYAGRSRVLPTASTSTICATTWRRCSSRPGPTSRRFRPDCGTARPRRHSTSTATCGQMQTSPPARRSAL